MKLTVDGGGVLSLILALQLLSICINGMNLINQSKEKVVDEVVNKMEEYYVQESDFNNIQSTLNNMSAQMERLEQKVNTIHNFWASNLVSAICTEEMSKEEKVLAICKWISENISNRENDYDSIMSPYNDTYGWLAGRKELCGGRSQIALKLLEYINIDAYQINLYDFPSVSAGGHSCREAYWDEKWHFIDVTMAGYFQKDGIILSLEEIIENPEAALEGMVVWTKTLDKYSSGEDAENERRMEAHYSVESLKNFKSYGRKDKETEVFVYPEMDLEQFHQLEIGKKDENSEDVRVDGMGLGISSYLAYGLSAPSQDVNIQTEWTFKNCNPGSLYTIEYQIFSSGDNGPAKFYVESENAGILDGKEFEIPASYNGEKINDFDGIITIKFVPNQSECKVRIKVDKPEIGCGANIDSITIRKENP